MSSIQLHASWLQRLKNEFQLDYMVQVKEFLKKEIDAGKTIYPDGHNIFAAFNRTPFDEVKVVIIGQDPYHGPGQAHGLSFSVNRGVKIPPSLRNIFKELQADLGCSPSKHGDLSSWAKQGVLLLNSVLTVEGGKAGAHQKKGWEKFTDKVIRILNQEKDGLVFILWGAHAQKKGAILDEEKHLILKSVHPSPLSASRGFFGTQPFSKTNAYLVNQGISPIEWCLT